MSFERSDKFYEYVVSEINNFQKTIITISSLSIGITFSLYDKITSKNLPKIFTYSLIFSWILLFLSLIICIFSIKIYIYKKNMDFTAQLIIDLTNDNNQPKYEKIRNKLTKQVNILNNLALYIFIFGCIAFGIYAIANLIYN